MLLCHEKEEILPFVTRMGLEGITLRKKKQKQKTQLRKHIPRGRQQIYGYQRGS